ncbi:MAG: hypothetical protein MJA29_08835 [Candidatus Omnitrophica bacterium]|nr:hypothetical protein [Candidatus Omnitrophota bacterium]
MNKEYGIPLLIIILLAVAYVSFLDGYPAITGDQTHYLLLGQSLALGQGYRELWTPQQDIHSKYPVFYPLVLAGIILLRGLDFFLIRLVNFAFLAAGLYALYYLIRGKAGIFASLAVLIFTATHPAVAWSTYHIFTEIPYLCLTLASLVFVERYSREEKLLSLNALAAAVCIAAAWHTRLAGASLLGAVFLFLIAGRGFGSGRLRARRALVVLSPAIISMTAWLFFNAFLKQTPSDYFGHYLSCPASAQCRLKLGMGIVRNIYSYIFYSFPYASSGMVFLRRNLFAVIISLLVLTGFCHHFLRKRRAMDYYVAVYCVFMLGFWDMSFSRRYIIPLIPFLFYYFLNGGLLTARRLGAGGYLSRFRLRIFLSLLLLAAAIRFGFFITDEYRYRDYTAAQGEDFLAATRWIRENTHTSELVMGLNPPDIYAYTGRASVFIPLTPLTGAQRAGYIISNKVGYILTSSVYNIHGEILGKTCVEPLLNARYDNITLIERFRQAEDAVYEVRLDF